MRPESHRTAKTIGDVCLYSFMVTAVIYIYLTVTRYYTDEKNFLIAVGINFFMVSLLYVFIISRFLIEESDEKDKKSE